jgi:hypothetical protein
MSHDPLFYTDPAAHAREIQAERRKRARKARGIGGRKLRGVSLGRFLFAWVFARVLVTLVLILPVVALVALVAFVA